MKCDRCDKTNVLYLYQKKRLNNPPFDDIIDAKRLPEGSFLVGRNEIQETVAPSLFIYLKTD